MIRQISLACAAAALAVVTFNLLSSDTVNEDTSVRAAVQEPASSEDPRTEALSEGSTSSKGERASVRVTTAAASTDSVPTPDRASPATRSGAVVGRVEVTRGETLSAHESGVARIVYWNADGPEWGEVEVVDGSFTVDGVESVHGMLLRSADLEEGTAYAREAARQVEGEWLFDATPIHVPTLRVVDAETDADLADIVLHVFESPSGWVEAGDVVHPGPVGRRTAKLGEMPMSPFPFPLDAEGEGAGYKEFIVGAPGYQWKSSLVEFSADDLYRPVVGLERAGAIDLDIVGAPPGTDLQLRIYHGGQSITEQAYGAALEADQSLTFDGLAAGSWRITAERGEVGSAAILGSVEVVVEVGATTAATLEVDASASEPAIEHPVRLALEIGSEWSIDTIDWTVGRIPDGVGHSNSVGGSHDLELIAGVLVTTVPVDLELTEGEYVFSIHELGIASSFVVAAPSTHAIRIDDPVELEVDLSDSRTGERISNGRVRYCSLVERRLPRYFDHRLAFDHGTNRYTGRVPTDVLEIYADAPGYESTRVQVDLATDDRRLALTLQPATQLVVRYTIEGEPFTLAPGPGAPGIELADGTAGLSGYGIGGGGARYTVKVRGGAVWRVSAPRVDGYQAPDPVEVEVGWGETREVELDYRRLP